MANSVSIEESNRIRESLGLKPLPVPGEEAEVPEDAQNWENHQEELKRKADRERRNESIKKARDKAKRFEKLEGKGLGDDDEPEEDSKTWLLGQKKRQKKLEKKRERTRKVEEEQRQRDEQAYTSRDLAGVKVAHEVNDFDMEGGEQVLTLKDATIDEYEEEGDELENIDLRESERLKDRLDLKKKRPVYDPNNMEDDAEGGFLQQYDDVIDGKKRKRFTLDIGGSAADERDSKRATTDSSRQQISLDILKDVVASDYQEPKEATFKKPKKTKKKVTRQRNVDDEEAPTQLSLRADAGADAMNIDKPEAEKPAKSYATVIDDDDLQSSLAKQRREALKKRKKTTASEMAQLLREEETAGDSATKDEEEPGLVLNETSEFVETIRPADIEEERQKAAAKAAQKAAGPEKTSDDEDDDDVDMDNYTEVKEEPDPEKNGTENPLTETGLEEDIKMNKGIGSTLGLLRQRGLIEDGESGDQVARFRDRQKFLSEKRRHEEASELKARVQRERLRNSGKLERMSAREREDYARMENKHRDQYDSRQLSEKFNRDYKPSFEIKHFDEYGREIDGKEAFKQMSHDFHGKGSGKQKTEKKLKKIDEEKKKAAQSIMGADQSTGLNGALSSTAKKTKQAGVRLG